MRATRFGIPRPKWAQVRLDRNREDRRIRYGVAGFAAGLLVGSVVAVASYNVRWVPWKGFETAPLAWGGLLISGIVILKAKDWELPSGFMGGIIARANCDPKFREKLKAYPRTVIRFRRDVDEITVLEEHRCTT